MHGFSLKKTAWPEEQISVAQVLCLSDEKQKLNLEFS